MTILITRRREIEAIQVGGKTLKFIEKTTRRRQTAGIQVGSKTLRFIEREYIYEDKDKHRELEKIILELNLFEQAPKKQTLEEKMDAIRKKAQELGLMEETLDSIFQNSQEGRVTPLWKKMTPEERARDFREWVSQLPKNSSSLSDTAFNRNSIYE